MDTLKTSVVVVLLLAGLYCVYVAMNKPRHPQEEVAWEADAADPALQIELGTPEAGDAGTGTARATSPTPAWDAASPSADPHASHDLGDRHSLPIPEPTTPAAPAIAAPDLIGAANSPLTNINEVPPLGESDVTAVSPSPAGTFTNELRDSGNSPNGLESPANRARESNRYSEYSPLRGESTAEVGHDGGPDGETPASAGSAQANVNDIAESGTPAVGVNAFRSAIESALTKIEAEAWKDALIKLSAHYNDPSLTAEEVAQLVDLLDPLAGKVIYSTEHLIEPAYQSQPGDTLMNIADRYQVPWQLLANINSIENPETLLAGRELKVVRGPFRAEVSLRKNELTLFVDKLYAGRFPISVGNDPAPIPGQYQINDKQPGRTYYAGSGQTVPIDDPNNPYGRVWLDLGSSLSIHGSPPNGASPGQGCIALTARDAGDVYGILSKGSSVVIAR